jgi:hypothetical protein
MTDDLLPDLTCVITTRDIDTPHGVLPAGSQGTVVSDYAHVGVYLVEFDAPWEVVQIPRCDRECQPLAAVFGLGQRLVRRYFDHRQGSRVSIWRIGWSAMRLRTSAR